MSVRTRLNLWWDIALAIVVALHILVLVLRFPKSDLDGFFSYIILIFGVIAPLYLLGELLYTDFSWLARPRQGRFAPDLSKVPKNRPPWFYFRSNDSPREYYLLDNYYGVCGDAMSIAFMAYAVSIWGDSPVLPHVLMAIAFLSLIYVRWRLHTCWARIYLK